jgi:glycosyltransferase involved in cell wall biosynthesis
MMYLHEIVPVMEVLSRKFDFDFVVISNQVPDFELSNLKFIPWNKATEIADLARLNIGIMPLSEDAWAKGKCGFKALQYMALGIPALVSPVGVNVDIVQEDYNGYICATQADWEKALTSLLLAPDKRVALGKNSRKYIEEEFSVLANKNNFLALFT